jgi:hypothetical protein
MKKLLLLVLLLASINAFSQTLAFWCVEIKAKPRTEKYIAAAFEKAFKEALKGIKSQNLSPEEVKQALSQNLSEADEDSNKSSYKFMAPLNKFLDSTAGKISKVILKRENNFCIYDKTICSTEFPKKRIVLIGANGYIGNNIFAFFNYFV